MGVGECQREIPVGPVLGRSQHIGFGQAPKPGTKTQSHRVGEIMLRFSFAGEAF